jgi:glycosyltransferase involved in cell wall biosynthesis
MVLFVHNRYRTTGGEERAVDDLMWLVRERLGEPAELLERRSSVSFGPAGAAVGLLRGGLQPQELASAVRLGGARVVHAHNLLPTFGWRALAAARAAGARVVLHLHQYRLVCAIGVCYTRGAECTRCHGRNTLPGVLRNCRGSAPEAIAYGASLALWQRRLVEQADAVLVPSEFARERLRELGAPLPWERVSVLPPPLRALDDASAPPSGAPSADAPLGVAASEDSPGQAAERAARGPYALVVSRLAVEKGVDVAIDACRIAGTALVVAGDGPQRAELEQRAGARALAERAVRFAGHVGDAELARLRAGAGVALVPSRSGESFGLAAAEAMAAGLPVVASRVGALPEIVEEQGLVAAGDANAFAGAIARVLADGEAGARAGRRVRSLCAPEVVARALAEVYGPLR